MFVNSCHSSFVHVYVEWLSGTAGTDVQLRGSTAVPLCTGAKMNWYTTAGPATWPEKCVSLNQSRKIIRKPKPNIAGKNESSEDGAQDSTDLSVWDHDPALIIGRLLGTGLRLGLNIGAGCICLPGHVAASFRDRKEVLDGGDNSRAGPPCNKEKWWLLSQQKM